MNISAPDRPILQNPWLLALIVLSAIMLVCTIFYPFGYDQAIFSVGGEMVLKQGAIPYRDILDTKPPLIFYIYALSSLLFGHHEWSIRAFDLIYQLAASIYFFRILRRYFDVTTSTLAVCFSILIYAGAGFWHTAQAESFALLPSLLLIDVTVRVHESDSSKVFRLGLIGGVAAAILIFLKFTFVFALIAAVIYTVLRQSLKEITILKFRLGLAFPFFLSIGGYILFLYFTGSLAPFVQSLQWVARYAQIEPMFGRDTISEQYFILFPERLISILTFSFFVLGVAGLGIYVRNLTDEYAQPILGLFALTFGFQLVGVLLERKMFEYQYLRAAWAIAPFIAMGFMALIAIVNDLRKKLLLLGGLRRMTGVGLLSIILLIALFYSPAIKLFSQSISWTRIALAHENAGVEVHKRIVDYYADEQIEAGDYLKQHCKTSDNIFVWGNDMSIYFYANKLPTTLCLTATPLRTPWTPSAWRDTLIQQLTQSNPRYFVAEFGDSKPYITGSISDSYQALLAWPALREFLANQYQPDTTIGHYKIFRRK